MHHTDDSFSPYFVFVSFQFSFFILLTCLFLLTLCSIDRVKSFHVRTDASYFGVAAAVVFSYSVSFHCSSFLMFALPWVWLRHPWRSYSIFDSLFEFSSIRFRFRRRFGSFLPFRLSCVCLVVFISVCVLLRQRSRCMRPHGCYVFVRCSVSLLWDLVGSVVSFRFRRVRVVSVRFVSFRSVRVVCDFGFLFLFFFLSSWRLARDCTLGDLTPSSWFSFDCFVLLFQFGSFVPFYSWFGSVCVDAPAVAVYETVRLPRLYSLYRSFVPFISVRFLRSVLFLLVSHHQLSFVSSFRFRCFGSVVTFRDPFKLFLVLVHPVGFLFLFLVAGNLCYFGSHLGPLRLRSRCMRPYGCCVFGEKNYNYRFNGLCSICSRNHMWQFAMALIVICAAYCTSALPGCCRIDQHFDTFYFLKLSFCSIFVASASSVSAIGDCGCNTKDYRAPWRIIF